jgi:beta-glucosidase
MVGATTSLLALTACPAISAAAPPATVDVFDPVGSRASVRRFSLEAARIAPGLRLSSAALPQTEKAFMDLTAGRTTALACTQVGVYLQTAEGTSVNSGSNAAHHQRFWLPSGDSSIMTTRDKDSSAPVSRRGFLALATGAAGLAATRLPASEVLGMPGRSLQAEQTASLDAGGIAVEHFEAARKRAAEIVGRMTLSEKVTQFGSSCPAIPRLGVRRFDYYGSEALNGLIHDGPVTSFPLPLAMGCSWNRSLVHRVYTAVSDEIWAWHKKGGQGLEMLSPPTVNMGTRDPRWGRIGENYSEDPYLVGQMAIYTIHGMQGDDPRYLKTIACAKHYIANDTEDDRHTMSAKVDPRSFWEYYTRGFEACVREGHVFTVMSSYNALNGIPTTASPFLLTDILRKRWGFRGFVLSDCGALEDICSTHHFVPTLAEAWAVAVNAGCDVNTCILPPLRYLRQAVDDMLVSESALDRSLVRSFTGRVLLGEFDPEDQIPYSRIPVSCLESRAHRELAREMARQSIVLFKNQNSTLPLDKGKVKKVAVIGPMADVCNLGGYSGTPWVRISALQGIKEALGIPIRPSYEKQAADFFSISTSPVRRLTGFEGGRLDTLKDGGQALTFLVDGSWAAYHDVLFTGAAEFHARVSSQSFSYMGHTMYGSAGTMEVHLDSLTGPVVATLHIPDTGRPGSWADVSAPIEPTVGTHTVYLRFATEPGSAFKLASFKLTPQSHRPTASQGLAEVTYAMGCTVTGEKDEAQFAEAVAAAKEADVALVFVGADEQVDSEGHDRDHIHLPGVQHELVQAVHAANPRTILVISSNCPVAVNWEQDRLPAIVGGMFLGEQQGHALADVLFGDYNPGGRASTTWYRRVEDLPDFHDFNIRDGRTYLYFQGVPLYAFGHGLSYSTFTYRNLKLSNGALSPGGKVTISVDVTNSGSRDGDEVVQAYVHVNAGTVIRPIKQLVDFDRVHIKAGETRSVSFDLAHDDQALRYWDEERYEFVVDPGTVDVMIGASSADIRLKERIRLDT